MNPAVVIPAYNRPFYLSECLKSIAANQQVIDGMPVYLFCDGGPKATVKENISVFESSGIANRKVIKSISRLEVDSNVILSVKHAFDSGHTHVILIEDDIVVSRHYISLLFNLLESSSSLVSNAGILNSGIQTDMSEEEFEYHKYTVKDCNAPLCSYLMASDTWNKIADDMVLYERLFGKWRESNRKGQSEWMKGMACGMIHGMGTNPATLDWGIPPSQYFTGEHFPMGQDSMLSIAIRRAGLCILSFVLNRTIHIGNEIGAHATKEWAENSGINNAIVHSYDSDRTNRIFRFFNGKFHNDS